MLVYLLKLVFSMYSCLFIYQKRKAQNLIKPIVVVS